MNNKKYSGVQIKTYSENKVNFDIGMSFDSLKHLWANFRILIKGGIVNIAHMSNIVASFYLLHISCIIRLILFKERA